MTVHRVLLTTCTSTFIEHARSLRASGHGRAWREGPLAGAEVPFRLVLVSGSDVMRRPASGRIGLLLARVRGARVDVYEAVSSRRAVRDFDDMSVPGAVLRRVLEAASAAPSSGNLQPWHVFVVSGEPLARLKALATERAASGDTGDPRQYPMYPEPLGDPYLDRFTRAADQRYAFFGVDRDDPQRPRQVAMLNAEAFGAPVVLFCYLDARVGPGQWADAGMYLQTVMLLLRAEGLHSCPQVMWTMFREDVRRTVGADDDMVLLCGLAIGYETREHEAHARTERAAIDETVSFVD
jgi:nitroreductase